MMLGNRRPWKFGPMGRFVSVFLLALSVVACVYGPVVAVEYGYNDDYPILLALRQGTFDSWILDFAIGGRPLTAPIIEASYRACGSIVELGSGRAVTLVGLALLVAAAYSTVRAGGWGNFVAAGCSLCMVLGPGFALFAAWFSCMSFSYVSTLALVAGIMIWKGVREKGRRGRVGWCGGGMALMVVVYAIYQPVAAFALFAITVLSWKELVEKNNARSFGYSTGVTLVAAGVYFLLFKVATLALGLNVGGQAGRSQLAMDWGDKIAFLFSRVLGSGFSMWGQFYGAWLERASVAIVLLLVLLASIRKTQGTVRLSGLGLVAMAVTLPLSILPLLVVAENHPGFRIQVVLHAMVLFYGVVGLERCIEGMERTVGHWMRAGFLIGVCAIFAMCAHREIRRGIVEPGARELKGLRQEINERFATFPEAIVYEIPLLAELGGARLAEFSGRGSSHLRWVTAAMLNLLLFEKFPNETNVATVYAGQPLGKQFETIDGFFLMSRDSGKVVEDSYWGQMRRYSNGWSKVEWFGTFDDRAFPWIRHTELGWLNCATNVKTGYSFHQNTLGWLWTSPECYPNVKREDDSWIYYSRQIGGGLSFYDYADEKWFDVVPTYGFSTGGK